MECHSSMVLEGTCHWEFEIEPVQIPTFQENWDPFIYKSVRFWAKFCPELQDFVFFKFSLTYLANLTQNKKILTNWPIHTCRPIPYFAFSRRFILLPVLATRPCRHGVLKLYLVTTPLGDSEKKIKIYMYWDSEEKFFTSFWKISIDI